MRSLVGLLFPRPDLTGNAAFVRVALLASAFLALITCAVSPAAAQKPEPSSVSSATAPQQAEAKTETGPTEAEERVALHNTLKEWRAEKNPVKRSELASAIQHTAIRLEEDRMVAELSRNGIPRRSIPLPDKVRDVRLMHVATFPFKTKGRWVNIDAVVRRITRDRIEVWLPTEGWLLDSTGKQLNHVTIKRRDKEGTGREWYGAFLPDGCYITTELWDMDRALYGFSAQGKPMWELKIPDLQPAPKSDSELWRSNNPSIGWARSTRNGLSWIMSLGTEGGYGYVTVTPLGKSSPLPKGATPWTLSYPGALGPRGYYCVQNVPNSKSDRTIHMHVASHGFECGYPDYNVQRRPPPAAGCGMDDESWFNDNEITIPSGGQFGFWPGTNQVWVEGGESIAKDGGDFADKSFLSTSCLWVLDSRGRYMADLEASCKGNIAADGISMLVEDGDNQIYAVKPNLTFQGPGRRFHWKDGETAIAHELYDDLKLGFFKRGEEGKEELILARWK